MLHQLFFGSSLILATVAVHAFCTVGVLRLIDLSMARGWDRGTLTTRGALIAAVVLLLCYATLLESAVWGAFYVWVGALESFGEALYFSIVTFTTLGYGDVTLGGEWRLLASLEAANGVIMIGWTTALVVALLHHLVRKRFTESSN